VSVHKVPILLITGRFFCWVGEFYQQNPVSVKNYKGTVNNPAQFVNISSILIFITYLFRTVYMFII